MKKRIFASLNWFLYALTWLFVVVSALYIVIFLCETMLETTFSYETWQAVILLCIAGVAWITVLHYRISLKWLLWVLAVMLFPVGPFLVFFVTTIGFVKLLIQSVGRRNVFASSRLRANEISVSPRGLVEYESRL